MRSKEERIPSDAASDRMNCPVGIGPALSCLVLLWLRERRERASTRCHCAVVALKRRVMEEGRG